MDGSFVFRRLVLTHIRRRTVIGSQDTRGGMCHRDQTNSFLKHHCVLVENRPVYQLVSVFRSSNAASSVGRGGPGMIEVSPLKLGQNYVENESILHRCNMQLLFQQL